MVYISRIGRLLAVFVMCFCLAGAASATVIVERSGDGNGSPLPFSNGETDFLYAVSWTQNFSFFNGSITALNLSNQDNADATIFFDLCYGQPDCVAPIAGDLVVPANTAFHSAQVNFGFPLNLSDGTWFLLAYAPGTPLAAWRTGAGESAYPGAALGLEYFTTSDDGLFTFGEGESNLVNAGYRVAGTVPGGEVPEPSTWLLTGSGLMLAGVVFRRRRG